MKSIIIFLVAIILSTPVSAQKLLEKQLSGYVNPEEIVTISETTPFNKAIELLSKVSEKLTGKKIVSTVELTTPIGIKIEKMPYMKALTIIVQYNDLKYEEKEDVIVIKKKFNKTENLTADVYAPVTTREVNIQAIFFEANVKEMRERGINWEALFSQNGISIGSGLISFNQEKENQGTGNQIKAPDFTIKSNNEFNIGNFSGTVSGILKFFETENLGEIIAKPNITVRDGMQGKIQIGSDISVKQRDFAGNIIDIFYPTGTIIEVTPHVYNEEGIDFVLLKVKVERSSAIPDIVSTEIKRAKVETDVLMLDGEEAVIGGLFVNEETTIRRGIPILKDLPWWVLGIRYLTGYDQKQVNKKEIIILLKVNIVPTLKERITKKKENLIHKQIIKDHKDIEFYKSKAFKKLEEDK